MRVGWDPDWKVGEEHSRGSVRTAGILLSMCASVRAWSPPSLHTCRFLQTAEMVKPSTPSPSHESSSSAGSEEGTEYYPHVGELCGERGGSAGPAGRREGRVSGACSLMPTVSAAAARPG